jgi:hypothetical protein
MLSLNLGSRPLTKLPASAFPSRADAYVCDKCERDITRHFRSGRAHVETPMGPERFRCRCGQQYLTGAIEWDHLGDWERKQRVWGRFGIGVAFSAIFSFLGLLAYLFLHFIFELRKGALVTGLVITALPFFLIQITFWPGVMASMWRTRFGTSIVSERN